MPALTGFVRSSSLGYEQNTPSGRRLGQQRMQQHIHIVRGGMETVEAVERALSVQLDPVDGVLR